MSAGAFCAICQACCTEFTLEPLGRNGIMVRVCIRCSSEVPRAEFGPQVAYEGAGPSVWSLRDEVKGPPGQFRFVPESRRARDGGTALRKDEVYRVPQMVGGKSRSFEDAQKVAMQQPWWGGDVAYYGRTARYYLWTRSKA